MKALDKIDHAIWLNEIERALTYKARKMNKMDAKVEAVKNELFANILFKALPRIFEHTTIYANAKDIGDISHKLEQFILLADELKKLSHEDSAFSSSSKHAAEEVLSHLYKGYDIDFEKIHDYGRRVWLHLSDQRSLSSKPNVNNLPPLIICRVICEAYERVFLSKPTISTNDLSNESGDPMDGTKYERVCRTIERLAGVELSWSSMRKASKTYKDDLDISRYEKNIERYSILDELPFEKT